MDVQTGSILESDKNGKDEIYYLQSTLRAWYNDMREKLLAGYQNGKFWQEQKWKLKVMMYNSFNTKRYIRNRKGFILKA